MLYLYFYISPIIKGTLKKMQILILKYFNVQKRRENWILAFPGHCLALTLWALLWHLHCFRLFII